MATVESISTADQLFEAPDLGRCELLRGELVMMSPAGSKHGVIALRIGGLLMDFVEPRGLGVVFGAETGFCIASNPDTVRAPDVAFVRRERIGGGLPEGFFPGAPDLAVEVLSPNDRASEVLAKVRDWLAAGRRGRLGRRPENRDGNDLRRRRKGRHTEIKRHTLRRRRLAWLRRIGGQDLRSVTVRPRQSATP